MQLVEIVEKNVKFHLNQDKTNQFIVTTVSKITNRQEMTVVEADLAETAVVEDLVEADVEPEDMAETDRGGGRFGRDRPPREMHTATCAECGTECQVPFKPNGEKPVYCNDCFQDKKPARDDRGRGRY